jgi:hypothetical protein
MPNLVVAVKSTIAQGRHRQRLLRGMCQIQG